MKIILEHSDIDAALELYLQQKMNLEIIEETRIDISLDADGHVSAIVRNVKMKPPAVVIAERKIDVAVVTAPTETVIGTGPKPLMQALDEQRKNTDWKESSAMSTDMAQLGKTDTTNFEDEIVGRPVPFASRS